MWIADVSGLDDPQRTDREFASIIDKLTLMSKRRPLGETGREALGQAYYYKCLKALMEKNWMRV